MLTPDILASIPDGQPYTVEPYLRLFRRGEVFHWQTKFRVRGEKNSRTRSLDGTYPGMSLETARALAAKLRGDTPAAIVAKGIAKAIKAGKSAQIVADANTPAFLQLDVPTFGEMAHVWLARPLPNGKPKSKATEKQHAQILAHLKPLFDKTISEITRIECRETLEAIQSAVGRPTAHRCKFMATRIFDLYADHHDAKFDNPCARSEGWLFGIVTEHHAALVKPADVGPLMVAIDALEPSSVAHALQLLSRTVVRQAELRGAVWGEIDLTAGVWSIPGARMKMKHPHVVPLSPQALAILAKQAALLGDTAPHKFVFPSNGNAAANHTLSGSALSFKLDQLGYKGRHTPHGMRSMFSTLAHEAEKDHRLIEMCLAHDDGNKVSASYNSATMIKARRELMTWYSNELERMKTA